MSHLYRCLPSVDRALEWLCREPELCTVPRPMLKDLVNTFFSLRRREIASGRIQSTAQLAEDVLFPALLAFVLAGVVPRFRRVLNATGVVVHTNLGRSLLADAAVRAVNQACCHYSNLEFDLESGRRGSRYSHVESLLCRLTGAEAALVVNNNAAAVLLALETLVSGREVIISRGQLVEIGGSFRIPDVMAKSGAVLREVGATNRTHLFDYEQAITEQTGALLRVHTSNFRIVGFTKQVSLQELRKLGDEYGLPVIEDLGSGALVRLPGLEEEPLVSEVIRDGADVVTFSGDKVLGGPQAGIIVGRTEYVERIKRNPMNRAMRIDKMTLAALEATLRLSLDPERATNEVPTLRMIATPFETLKSRAGRLARLLRTELKGRGEVSTRRAESLVGGGAHPERGLPTVLVEVAPLECGVEALRDALLQVTPPLVGRVEHGLFCLDSRTLVAEEFPLVASALRNALASVEQ
ncbi:L-seryl-tRNA(Sec) selenium transferase [Paucidesulfovibrio gracilis DSM 16080]|uniref:L-seryl-tRNA(Sec) selenium transferase n=1 Tax=Paucidesulfovibrio gracilis DSM 16080 TaxID=1121449 RepID=A0A1T4WKD4_9BACT|nr:L-seryl-tRNA(Sec) selenium transferase [Paucidesulfovibrio gracilis]SKA77375.1 L-seryl-tRNA(Sec) selenium transferase [Paucidesulfovibrio gracilis DSM 16080]